MTANPAGNIIDDYFGGIVKADEVYDDENLKLKISKLAVASEFYAE